MVTRGEMMKKKTYEVNMHACPECGTMHNVRKEGMKRVRR